MSASKLRLIHRPESPCHCGEVAWEVEKIEGRYMVSRVCRDCNPYWARRENAMAYRRARKQIEELLKRKSA